MAGQPERSQTFDSFGIEGQTNLELFIQARDLLDKGIELFNGDFFVYGSEIYEVIQANNIENIYGQAEYDKAYKVEGQLAKIGQFDIDSFKELLEQSKYFKDSQAQKKFVQQRGLTENEEGFTNDRREMRERLGEGMENIALDEGPRKIDVDTNNKNGAPLDAGDDPDGAGFYNE